MVPTVYYYGYESTDTLFIDARKVGQDETLDVKFSFEKSLEIFEKRIGYLNLGKRLVIWCRFSGIYTGYSFHVQSLESRNHKKPTISVLNENFVRDLELIPASVVFCGGAGADEAL